MKRDVRELACLGGAPAFAQPLHVGRPNLGDRAELRARIDGALDRRWFTNDGPLVRELEQRLADYLQVGHCVAMCNATVGMEVLAHALGISGEVIVPAFTFIATPHAFSWVGLKPVFCDVEPATHTLDPADVARALGPQTGAIMGVHLWGGACDVDGLQRVAAQRAVPLLFDAAHAFGSRYQQRPIGSFGNAEVFSFHATKFFNTFEGGAITTNDDALARELRLMRNFGISGYDAVDEIGTNAKLNEISAAMGLTTLDVIEQLLAVNRERLAQYQEELRGVDALRLLQPRDVAETNQQYCVLEVSETAGLSRDQLLALLWAENVRARRYFYPGCQHSAPYAGTCTRALPVTERLVNSVLVLPTGGSVSSEQLTQICELLRFALQHADELRERLPATIPPGGLKT